MAQRGARNFVELRCHACHAVRGHVDALIAPPHGGPDLTHLASRAHLGAGSLRNDADGLRRWVSDAHAVKADVRMPSYAHLDAATIESLVAYLSGLH